MSKFTHTFGHLNLGQVRLGTPDKVGASMDRSNQRIRAFPRSVVSFRLSHADSAEIFPSLANHRDSAPPREVGSVVGEMAPSQVPPTPKTSCSGGFRASLASDFSSHLKKPRKHWLSEVSATVALTTAWGCLPFYWP